MDSNLQSPDPKSGVLSNLAMGHSRSDYFVHWLLAVMVGTSLPVLPLLKMMRRLLLTTVADIAIRTATIRITSTNATTVITATSNIHDCSYYIT